MDLYHGTHDGARAEIMSTGLREPCLTDDLDLAWYYAECAAEEVDGEPVVLTVQAAGALRADVRAIEEPVFVGDWTKRWDRESRAGDCSREEALWRAATRRCQELDLDDWSQLPAADSLALCGSVCSETIPPDLIWVTD